MLLKFRNFGGPLSSFGAGSFSLIGSYRCLDSDQLIRLTDHIILTIFSP